MVHDLDAPPQNSLPRFKPIDSRDLGASSRAVSNASGTRAVPVKYKKRHSAPDIAAVAKRPGFFKKIRNRFMSTHGDARRRDNTGPQRVVHHSADPDRYVYICYFVNCY